jgi:hypothetical protein
MDFRILNECAATGYKDQSHDKAKDRKKVPVHAQGYIFIVFELITNSWRAILSKVSFRKTG